MQKSEWRERLRPPFSSNREIISGVTHSELMCGLTEYTALRESMTYWLGKMTLEGNTNNGRTHSKSNLTRSLREIAHDGME